MSDEGKITVTIKYDKGYEATWAVFHGDSASEVRSRILEYFGQDTNVFEGMSLHEVVLKVTAVAHGTQTFVSELGAEVIPTNGTGEVPGPSTTTSARGSAAFKAAAETPAEPEDPYAAVVALFESADSIKGLKKMYAQHKAAYEASETVQEAYKKKYKELK